MMKEVGAVVRIDEPSPEFGRLHFVEHLPTVTDKPQHNKLDIHVCTAVEQKISVYHLKGAVLQNACFECETILSSSPEDEKLLIRSAPYLYRPSRFARQDRGNIVVRLIRATPAETTTAV